MRHFCWVIATAALAQTASLRQISDLSRSLVERVDPAVVQVIARGFAPSEGEGQNSRLLQQRRENGSGVIVDSSGYIVTNAHVVGMSARVDVLIPVRAEPDRPSRSLIKPAGRLRLAKVVGVDRETDLAVLKVEETGLPALRFAEGNGLREGDLVFAFGSPFGLKNSATMGIVSSVARQVRVDDSMAYIQTDASINPGNSGGPLVDAEGTIVGINTFFVSQSGGNDGIGFAIPSETVRHVYEQIREKRWVRRGQIGIVGQTITPGMAAALGLPAQQGVIVADVRASSSADAAGIQIKDIVLSWNGKPVEDARTFGMQVYQAAGTTGRLEILRGNQRLDVQIAVLERPRDPDRLLALATARESVVRELGILALDLDGSVLPLMPSLRRLNGVVVAGVIAEAPSQGDYLASGDVIYEVNGRKVTSIADMRQLLSAMKSGQPVVLHLERSGQLQFLEFEID